MLSIEIRKIIEPDLVSEVANRSMEVQRIRQHAIGLCQALIEYEFGKAGPVNLE